MQHAPKRLTSFVLWGKVNGFGLFEILMFQMCSPPSSQYVHIKNPCSMFVMGKGKWLIIKQKTLRCRPWTTN